MDIETARVGCSRRLPRKERGPGHANAREEKERERGLQIFILCMKCLDRTVLGTDHFNLLHTQPDAQHFSTMYKFTSSQLEIFHRKGCDVGSPVEQFSFFHFYRTTNGFSLFLIENTLKPVVFHHFGMKAQQNEHIFSISRVLDQMGP